MITNDAVTKIESAILELDAMPKDSDRGAQIEILKNDFHAACEELMAETEASFLLAETQVTKSVKECLLQFIHSERSRQLAQSVFDECERGQEIKRLKGWARSARQSVWSVNEARNLAPLHRAFLAYKERFEKTTAS